MITSIVFDIFIEQFIIYIFILHSCDIFIGKNIFYKPILMTDWEIKNSHKYNCFFAIIFLFLMEAMIRPILLSVQTVLEHYTMSSHSKHAILNVYALIGKHSVNCANKVCAAYCTLMKNIKIQNRNPSFLYA